MRNNPYGTIKSNDYSDEMSRHHYQSNRASLASNNTGSMRVKSNNRKSLETQEKDVNGNPSGVHARSASYDVYNEMTRPGSRVGFVDPKKYSHYINYEEIRHHLK